MALKEARALKFCLSSCQACCFSTLLTLDGPLCIFFYDMCIVYTEELRGIWEGLSMKLWSSGLNTPTWLYQLATLLLTNSPLSVPPSLLAVLFLPAAGEVEPFLLEWSMVSSGDLEVLHFLGRLGSCT